MTNLKTARELRVEHLLGIVRDIGSGMASGPVTETDAWEARQVLKALELGQNPPETERERLDKMLAIHRG